MVMLRPRAGGRYLSPEEVIRRVKAACASSACAYVETCAQGAREQALEWMNQHVGWVERSDTHHAFVRDGYRP